MYRLLKDRHDIVPEKAYFIRLRLFTKQWVKRLEQQVTTEDIKVIGMRQGVARDVRTLISRTTKGSFTIVNIYVLVQRVLGGRGVRGQRTIFKMLINLWNIL